MTTITVNERTKSGKSFLSLAKKVAKVDGNIKVNDQKIPNAETLQAMYEAENGINMTRTTSVEDLMNKLFS
jgi:antitoxin component of RelBE/YafQ-DinJ toxin-antitoxin module